MPGQMSHACNRNDVSCNDGIKTSRQLHVKNTLTFEWHLSILLWLDTPSKLVKTRHSNILIIRIP